MSKRKLLLADDSVTVQKVVNLAFESENIEVITADNGNSALEKIVEFLPDLVMADINLSGANGYDICERIKQNEETKHIPVILLVGSFVPFSEEKAERVGSDGFLKKPFQSIGLLINKVTELLGGNDEESEEASPETGFNEADTQPMPAYKLPEKSGNDYSMGEEFGDDEMIETERVGDYSFVDETSKYETSSEFDAMPEDSENTQPVSYTDVEEHGLADHFEEKNEETVYELADEPDDFQPVTDYEFNSEPAEESSTDQANSYDEYSTYEKSEEATDYLAPQASSALNLDDLELLELPPLGKLPETSAPHYSISDEMPDNSEIESAQETVQPITDDYSDYAETTTEESLSTSETIESLETQENYSAPAEAMPVNFDKWNDQTESVENDYETVEPEEPETAESYELPESETEEMTEYPVSIEDENEDIDEEIPASYPEETAAAEEESSVNEDATEAKVDAEMESMIAEQTGQEISKASANDLVVHYFPPEVIDAIAERVVEKLAEKLGR